MRGCVSVEIIMVVEIVKYPCVDVGLRVGRFIYTDKGYEKGKKHRSVCVVAE